MTEPRGTATTERPRYAQTAGWQRIQECLPAHLRHDGLVIDPSAPGTVPDEDWFTSGGAVLHLDRYEPLGPAPARPATLLLLHGGDANGRLLAPYALMAARAGHRAVAFDLPGYGLT